MPCSSPTPAESDIDSIELARLTNDAPDICSAAADEFGRCRSRFHTAECSHSVEHTLAAGVTPEASQAWRQFLLSQAANPLADSRGQIAYDQDGVPMSASAHFEAQTGIRVRTSPFYDPERRELRKPAQRQVLGDSDGIDGYPTRIPASTRRTADAIRAQNPELQQSRRQSSVGRRYNEAEAAAEARRNAHPDNRWPQLRAQRAAAQAALQQVCALAEQQAGGAACRPSDRHAGAVTVGRREVIDPVPDVGDLTDAAIFEEQPVIGPDVLGGYRLDVGARAGDPAAEVLADDLAAHRDTASSRCSARCSGESEFRTFLWSSRRLAHQTRSPTTRRTVQISQSGQSACS